MQPFARFFLSIVIRSVNLLRCVIWYTSRNG